MILILFDTFHSILFLVNLIEQEKCSCPSVGWLEDTLISYFTYKMHQTFGIIKGRRVYNKLKPLIRTVAYVKIYELFHSFVLSVISASHSHILYNIVGAYLRKIDAIEINVDE
jgi:hypothetical protein